MNTYNIYADAAKTIKVAKVQAASYDAAEKLAKSILRIGTVYVSLF